MSRRLMAVLVIMAIYGSTVAGFWITSVRTVTFYPTKDSYSWQSFPKANNGGSNNFEITSSVDRLRNMRGWLEFNISTIPPDVWILNAKLLLRIWHKTTNDPSQRVGDTTGRIYGVYRLLQPWAEYGINWENQPNYTEDHHVTAPVPPGQGGWYGPLLWMEWDLTDMVKDWHSDVSNYGVVVRDTQEDSQILYSTQFFTHDDVPNEGYFPILIVTYVHPYAVAAVAVLFVVEGLFIIWLCRTKLRRSM